MNVLDASRAAQEREGANSALQRPWRLASRTAKTFRAAALIARKAMRTDDDDFHAKAEILAGMAQKFCSIHNVEVTVNGSIPPGPNVLVMNHLGWVDPMILGAVGGFQPIAKVEVATWPLIGAIARSVGVMFVARGNVNSGFRTLRRSLRCLEAGVSVLNFPEGTTSEGKDVLPFYRGIFGVAQIAKVPIVPVRLSFENPAFTWTNDAPFLPHYLALLGRSGERVSLDILEPLNSAEFESAEALAHRARESLRRGRQARLPDQLVGG